MHDGNWNDGMGNGNWWWVAMVIMMVAFWGGLIWLAVTLLKRNQTAHLPAPAGAATSPASVAVHTKQTAQEILAERLARGEIEPDDYRQRLEALRTPPSS